MPTYGTEEEQIKQSIDLATTKTTTPLLLKMLGFIFKGMKIYEDWLWYKILI